MANNNDTSLGITLTQDVELSWKCAGYLDAGDPFEKARGAAGLYAFVLDDGSVLYLGKAGGLKPEKPDRWANDVRTRLATHWKSGLIKGLVKTTGTKIQVWFMDVKLFVDPIWERDMERIENDLIKWFRLENTDSLPGNAGYEGTSPRGFLVHVHRVDGEPLPRITLKVGTSVETRLKHL